MNANLKEILTAYHRDAAADVEYFRKKLYSLPTDATADDRADANNDLFRYMEVANRIDALVKELLIAELENATSDAVNLILYRYHADAKGGYEYFDKQWRELPPDATPDERAARFDRRCRYMLIAERVDALIGAVLLSTLD